MSYPSGNSGYYTGYSSYGPDAYDREDTPDDPLPRLLLAAVAVLGVGAYGFSFGPVFDGQGSPGWFVRFGVAAAAVAVFGLLPGKSPRTLVIAVLSVIGFLDALSTAVTDGGVLVAAADASTGWAMTVIAVVTGLQAVAAVAAHLLWPDVEDDHSSEASYQAYLEYYNRITQQYYGQQGAAPEREQRGGYGQAAGYGEAGGSASARAPRVSQEADYGDFASQAAPPPRASFQQATTAAPLPTAQAGTATPPTGMPQFGVPRASQPGEPSAGEQQSSQ